MNGKCPNCGSADYGQEPINMRENQCHRCGHIGSAASFHIDRLPQLASRRIEYVEGPDAAASPVTHRHHRARAMPAVTGFHTPPRNKLWYLKDD